MMMKRSMACVFATAALLAATALPASAAAPKPTGCPNGDWTGPVTTLEAATWWSTTFGDGGSPDQISWVDVYLQARADNDADSYICYKLLPQDRLPDPAQVHNDGSVIFVDARSTAS